MCKRRRARQQIESLKDEADFPVADGGEFVVIELADQAAREPVIAARGRIEAADQVHQRGFSRAGRTHDGDVFAFVDHDVHAAQGMQLLGAHFIGLPEIFGLDDDAGIHQVLAEILRPDFFDSHGHCAPGRRYIIQLLDEVSSVLGAELSILTGAPGFSVRRAL